jgi:hypothetical protein
MLKPRKACTRSIRAEGISLEREGPNPEASVPFPGAVEGLVPGEKAYKTVTEPQLPRRSFESGRWAFTSNNRRGCKTLQRGRRFFRAHYADHLEIVSSTGIAMLDSHRKIFRIARRFECHLG